MFQKKDKFQYNLRPRTCDGFVLNDKNNNDDRKIEKKIDISKHTESHESHESHESQESQESQEIIVHEIIMEDINLAIQEFIEEVTEDIIDKISEIVATSIDSQQLEECDEEEEDSTSDVAYTPDKMIQFFQSEDMVLYPRKRLLLTRDKWQKGLTEEEITQYKYIFEDIKNKQKLTIVKILKSNLSALEKEKSVKKFLHSQPGRNSCEDIIHLIKEREETPLTSQKLEELDNIESQLSQVKSNNSTIKHQIYNLPVNINIKSLIFEKYLQYEALPSSSTDSFKLKEWLKWTINLPWDNFHTFDDNKNTFEFIKNVQIRLNKVYGLKNAKEEIMMFVLKRLLLNNKPDIENISKTSLGGQILAIEGPPGVGKTYLLKHLASSLNIPFESIPLGGCKDASYLDGHGYTYEGSMPGRIVQSLKNLKCNNGIIYFDEIDKLSGTQNGQEVSALLLHILDPSQNKEFYDKYIGDLPIDLSKIFFVLSINDREKIDHVLRQRLFIINIPAPTPKEKIEIATQCMIPLIENEFNFKKEDIVIPRETLSHILKSCANEEKGVRNFKHILMSIYKRLFFINSISKDSSNEDVTQLDISFWIKNFKLPFTLKPEHISSLLKGTEQGNDMGESVKRMFM